MKHVVAAALLIAASLPAADWYHSGGTWTNRKAIAIDHTKVAGTSVLTNFPVLLSLRDDDLRTLANGGSAGSATGADILFTAGDGTTKLAHELESYDPKTGKAVAWVSVPQLSPLADTILYVYFGNSQAANQANIAAVWDSDYQGVYHLADANGTDLLDSSSRRRDLVRGIRNRPSLDNLTGKISGAQQFGPSHSDYAMSAAGDSTSGPATLSLWVLRVESYDKAAASGYVTGSISGEGDLEFRSTPDPNTLGVHVDGVYRPIVGNINPGWNYVTLTRNGTSWKAYYNGSLAQSYTIPAPAIMAFQGLGNIKANSSFSGEIDEVRWSHVERSAEWIATEYANQSAPAVFFTLGRMEPERTIPAPAKMQIYQESDVVAASVTGTEDVTKRTRQARHFRNSDGSWTAIIGNNVNSDDGTGNFTPWLRTLSQTGDGGWQLSGGASATAIAISKTAAGHDVQHSYRASDGSQHAFTLGFPDLKWREATGFAFALGGLAWTLDLNRDRTEFATTVTSPQGVQTYSFGYKAAGMALAVNGSGNLVGDDGVSLTRAAIIRTDGQTVECSPWSIGDKTLSFTCDDSAFPPSVFPYVIDPALTPPVANLKSCRHESSGATSCTPGSFKADNSYYGLYYTNATWTMDTSSIPTSATINSVLLNMTTGNAGGTYTISGANNVRMGTCGPVYGTPATCANVSAPTNSIARGTITSFTGTCPDCGRYPSGGPPYYSSPATLTSFSLTVNYTYGPASITIATSPAGRTFSVDGASYSSNQTFQWTPGSVHTIAIASTTQAGGTGTQYVWTSWSDSGAVSHTITTPVANTTYTANFKTQYYLTTSAPGVGGTISPASAWYDSGAGVQISAAANTNYVFSGFSGAITGATNPRMFTITAPSSVTANFTFQPVGYGYYYIDPFSTVNTSNWTQNGVLTSGSGGLTSADSNGGSLISQAPVPDGSNAYEVKATVTLAQSGGTYVSYLRAGSDALSGPGGHGTYLAFELQNPTFTGSTCTAILAAYSSVSGTVTAINATSVPCHSGMVIRSVLNDTSNIFLVYIDNVLYSTGTASIASGLPGVGVRGAPAGNSIAQVQLGPLDRTPPAPVDAATVKISASSNEVDLQWTAPVQTGVGIASYNIYRDSVLLRSVTTPMVVDTTVQPNTSYTYSIAPVSYHSFSSSTPVSLTTPATPAYARRTGVRGTGAYWGGMGENIDLMSGNLNFTLPLLQAQGRGGWKVGFNLTYNSQNWRKDSTTWNLGQDTGYGYGWKLLAGALTPQYGPGGALSQYQFIDATGAEYWLNVNINGVWTSQEGIYISYDSNANRLYFNDGSFWIMGCTSAGSEPDSGTRYPTAIQDPNGNQITIRYAGPNASARIDEIEDARAVTVDFTPPGRYASYQFTYSGGHLSTIVSRIGTAEGYTFTVAPGALVSPFDGTSYPATSYLSGVTVTGLPLSYQFTTGNSGELTQVTFPYGGFLNWTYSTATYAGSRMQREVTGRSYQSDAALGQRYFTIARDAGDSGRTVHLSATLDDVTGNSRKIWTFAQAGGSLGLATSYEVQDLPGQTPRSTNNYTWAQNAGGNWYVSGTTATLERGAAGQVQKQATQTLDDYGNVTTATQTDWGGGSARTYSNTYLTDPAYLSRYIRTRPLSSSVTPAGGSAVTLFTNTYDVSYACGQAMTDLPGSVRQHDASYGTSYTVRGNVSFRDNASGRTCAAYDTGGNVVKTITPAGVVSTSGFGASTNWLAPATTAVGALTETLSWTSFLGLQSATGPNGDTASTIYDSYARPSQTTSATGAVTTYAYASSAPWTTTATTNGRWVRTTVDGFGRTMKVESGSGAPTSPPVSVTETTYDACGCSPVGKTKMVSMPHTPAAGAVWTSYSYDGQGRTLSVTAPDGSVKSYLYAANTVKVTDEAGQWKKYTMDGFGNVTQVQEPDPANPATASYYTYYSYDVLNHLTLVNMPRPTGTQTRTFNYGTPPGPFLLSATNPESGTVSYTYSSGRLVSKTDAKNQQTQYSYDSYGRLSQVRHYPVAGGSEDVCAQVNLSYDSNPYATGFDSLAGRLAVRKYQVCLTPSGAQPITTTFYDMFGYTAAGQVTKKRLRAERTFAEPYPYSAQTVNADLDASWSYDNEGRMTGVTYPTGWNYMGETLGGQTYTYGYDAMGRLNTMTNPGYQIVSGVTYGPAGEVLTIAGMLNESRTYNSRLQLTGFNGASYTYAAAPANNGKILTETVSGETVTYQYDSLNRLISAVSSGTWGQGFSYDGFGNLTGKSVLKGSAPYLSVGVDAGTNRIVGYNYDANGNQLTTNTQGLWYDVENRLGGLTNYADSTGSSYQYDPDNRRVYTSDWAYDYGSGVTTVSNETVYFYGVTGQLMGTYGLAASAGQVPYTNASLKMMWAGDRVYFGGRYVASTTGGLPVYLAPPDRLGSKGLHYPYGEDRGVGGMFGTYTRDAGGLDYAVNRYYSSGLGRFTSPDPYRATKDSVNNPADPGSWNRYGYGGGDPTNLYDPNGLESISPLTPITFACPVGAGEGLQWVRCDLFGWTPPRPLPADPTHCDPGWFDLQSTHKATNGKTYSGADLDFAARVIFAEVSGTQMALAGGYSDQLDAERDAIASVLYSRIGNTGFGSPQSFTAVGLQLNQFQAVTGNQKQTQKFNRSNFASSKNLNQADCDDLNSAIEAVRKIMKDGPTVDFTFFWAASTGHSGTVIGGSVFWGSTNP